MKRRTLVILSIVIFGAVIYKDTHANDIVSERAEVRSQARINNANRELTVITLEEQMRQAQKLIDEANAERRHRELLEAIKESKE